MKKTLIALGAGSLAAALAAVTPAALAQDYQGEASLHYVGISPEVGPSDSAFGAGFTWHFDRVSTQGHPLGEAAYLSRASNVSLSYTTIDKADQDIGSIGAEFFLDNIYLAGSYTRTSNGIDTNAYGLSAGLFVAPTTLLRINHGRNNTTKVDSWGVGFKTVAKMVGDTALSVEADYTTVDDAIDSNVLSLSGDYYFNPQFSAGVRYAHESNDIDSDSIWGVGAQMFFTPSFSGGVEYDTNGDDDTYTVRLALRF